MIDDEGRTVEGNLLLFDKLKSDSVRGSLLILHVPPHQIGHPDRELEAFGKSCASWADRTE